MLIVLPYPTVSCVDFDRLKNAAVLRRNMVSGCCFFASSPTLEYRERWSIKDISGNCGNGDGGDSHPSYLHCVQLIRNDKRRT